MTAPSSPRPRRLRAVCTVTQALHPDLAGGSSLYVHELSNAQVRAGLEVVVHTVDYRRPPQVPGGSDALYKIERHRFVRMPWDALGNAGNPLAWRVRRAVARSPGDVVHLHSHLFFASLFGAWGARRTGRATVLTVHGVRAVQGAAVNLLQEAWLRTVSRHLFRTVDVLHCLTPEDAAEVQRYGADAVRIRIIPNAFDPRRFHDKGAQRSDRVVWTGRLAPEKSVDVLLDAWSRIAPRFPSWRLVLIGDGPLGARLRDQAKGLGIQGSVEFAGMRTQEDVASILRSARLFTLPSLKEGFPKALLEAMACGLPAVVTSGMARLVGEAGRAVPPADPAALADALAGLMADPVETRRLGKAAVRHAAAFAWPLIEKQMEAAYRDAMGLIPGVGEETDGEEAT